MEESAWFFRMNERGDTSVQTCLNVDHAGVWGACLGIGSSHGRIGTAGHEDRGRSGRDDRRRLRPWQWRWWTTRAIVLGRFTVRPTPTWACSWRAGLAARSATAFQPFKPRSSRGATASPSMPAAISSSPSQPCTESGESTQPLDSSPPSRVPAVTSLSTRHSLKATTPYSTTSPPPGRWPSIRSRGTSSWPMKPWTSSTASPATDRRLRAATASCIARSAAIRPTRRSTLNSSGTTRSATRATAVQRRTRS